MIAITYVSAPYCRFDRLLLGKTWWAEHFRNEVHRKLLQAFEASGLTIRQVARRLNWTNRRVMKALRSPKALGRGVALVAELAWAMGFEPQIELIKGRSMTPSQYVILPRAVTEKMREAWNAATGDDGAQGDLDAFISAAPDSGMVAVSREDVAFIIDHLANEAFWADYTPPEFSRVKDRLSAALKDNAHA